jgi:uncharacterized protein (TIGR02147 family)
MEQSSINVQEYLDYREFLNAYYRHQKLRHSHFSLRYISQRTGIDAAHIMRVLQGKRHLSEKSAPAFARLCKLDGKEERYFTALVEFNTAKSSRRRQQAFERLLALSGLDTTVLQPEQYEFYTKWYYTAIRALIGMHSFRAKGDFSRMGAMLSPALPASKARQAVALLKKLDLVVVTPDGLLETTQTHITTGARWRSLAVKHFQTETLRLALESLERHHKSVRDISTVTVGISARQLPALRERIAEFRQSMMAIAEENRNPDDVYQLNIQFFPLTDTNRDGNRS